jgi:hypothetical protein
MAVTGFPRRASTHVSNVIFIATPHKGADMASGLIGRLRSRLVRLPAKLVAMGSGLVEKATVFRTIKEPMSTSSAN